MIWLYYMYILSYMIKYTSYNMIGVVKFDSEGKNH